MSTAVPQQVLDKGRCLLLLFLVILKPETVFAFDLSHPFGRTVIARRIPLPGQVPTQQKLQSTPKQPPSSTISSQLYESMLPPLEELELSYGEQSRPFRRDFFNHEKWVRHRSPDRFTNNLLNMLRSGVVRQLVTECSFIGITASFICFWNGLFGGVGFEDLQGMHHEAYYHLPALELPLQPFTLSSPALGLLLVFRTNASYQRWDEARKAWGVVVNNSRTIARQTSAWIKYSDMPFEEKQVLLGRTRDAIWAFPRTLARHLLSEREDEEAYVRDVQARLSEPFASELIRWKRHRPSRALYELSNAINELPLEVYRRISVDESVSHLCDAMGGCDRLYTSPVPSVYTRHTARFLEVWLLLLPFPLYNIMANHWNHWGTVPVAVLISFFLLGVEELSIQLEEPFSLLPLHKIAEGIGKSADEHFDWNEKDFQRQLEREAEEKKLREEKVDARVNNYLQIDSKSITDMNSKNVSLPEAIRNALWYSLDSDPPMPEIPIPQPEKQQQAFQGSESLLTSSSSYESLAEALKAMTKEQ